MNMPISISVLNHKGGVLKTTLTASLGAGFARYGKRVLVVDLDPQQDLTEALIGQIPFEPNTGMFTLLEALCDEVGLDALIKPTTTDGLDIIPAAEDLIAAELNLVSKVARENILKNCLKKTRRLSDYDLIIFDNPPNIGLVVMNSLVASNCFLVPCSADKMPMTGLTLLGKSVESVRKIVPDLSLLGVVITRYDMREIICRDVENKLKEVMGDDLFETRIRVNTNAKNAPRKLKTIFDYERSEKGKGTKGTEDYSKLVEEILTRLGLEFTDPEQADVNETVHCTSDIELQSRANG